jgi:hypothetical protein
MTAPSSTIEGRHDHHSRRLHAVIIAIAIAFSAEAIQR